MDENIKKLLLAALSQYRGDDLERAQLAFRNRTPAQMQEYYGQSDQSCQQILEGYEHHVARCEAAQKWLEAQ